MKSLNKLPEMKDDDYSPGRSLIIPFQVHVLPSRRMDAPKKYCWEPGRWPELQQILTVGERRTDPDETEIGQVAIPLLAKD